MLNVNTIKNINKLCWPFDKILPLVYNDALTFQENIQLLIDKVNEVIDNADSVQDLVYKILQAYVKDYTITLSYDEDIETINFDLLLTILQQPQDIAANEEATEATPFAYIAGATNFQWEYSVDSGETWFNSTEDGATTYMLHTLALTDRNDWLWRVKAWNTTRVVTSNPISIKVVIE